MKKKIIYFMGLVLAGLMGFYLSRLSILFVTTFGVSKWFSLLTLPLIGYVGSLVYEHFTVDLLRLNGFGSEVLDEN